MKLLTLIASRGRRAPIPSITVAAAFAFTASPSFTVAQEGDGNVDPGIIIWPGTNATMEVDDITQAGVVRQVLTVTYNGFSPIDVDSIGDGDIWGVSTNGYNQLGQLIDVEVIEPQQFDANGNPIGIDGENGLIALPFFPRPAVIARYVLTPPHDGPWNEDDNGAYAVLLQPGEVLQANGIPLSPQLLGYFHVRIGVDPEPVPVKPAEVEIAIDLLPDPTLRPNAEPPLFMAVANVRVKYNEGGVDVSWSDGVEREGQTFIGGVMGFAPANPVRAPGTVAENRFNLGLVGPGGYRFALSSFDEIVGSKGFRVPGGNPDPVPIDPLEVAIEIEQLPTPGAAGAIAHTAVFVHVTAVFPPGTEVEWGERVQREGRSFIGKVAGFLPPGSGLPPDPNLVGDGATVVAKHTFDLGVLRRGEYRFALQSHRQIVASEAFAVEGGPPFPLPINPSDVGITFEHRPVPSAAGDPFAPGPLEQVIAHVKVVYNEVAEVEWGDDVKRDGNTVIGSVRGFSLGLDVAEETESEHSFILGVFGPGEYRFGLDSHGDIVASKGFKVDGGNTEPRPVFPVETDLKIHQVSDAQAFLGGWVVDVRMVFREPVVDVQFGDVDRERNTFRGNVRAVAPVVNVPPVEPNEDGLIAPRHTVVEGRFRLGVIEERGRYLFELIVNGRGIVRDHFVVPPIDPDPEPAIPDAAEIRVAMLPQIAIFPPPPSQWGATVWLRFENPDGVEVVNWGEVKREGRNNFFVDIEAVRHRAVPGDVNADGNNNGGLRPPPPSDGFHHEYVIGHLEPGEYRFTVLSRNRRVATETFKVEGDDPSVPKADVDLKIDAGNPVVVEAVIDFLEEGWVVVDAGTPRRERNHFVIDARVLRWVRAASRPTVYNLGELRPGDYSVSFKMNGETFARSEFHVEGDPDPNPRPVIHGIDVRQGDVSWFAEVGVVLAEPSLQVLDWGAVEQDGNGFFVSIVVGRGDPNIDPDDNGNNVEGDDLRIPGVPPDFPVRLVKHTYNLGPILEPGSYFFAVTHENRVIARESFRVRGEENDPPAVAFTSEKVREPGEEPHKFEVHYSDNSGLDLESIREATVVVTRGRDEIVAELVDWANTEDFPPSQAFATYSVAPPGGAWDVRDNGSYHVKTDPEEIRDLHGNHIRRGTLGRFQVTIWPEPPEPPRDVEVNIDHTAAGLWLARVGLKIPAEFAARDDWEVDWGEVRPRGNALVAQVKFRRAGQDDGGGRDENDDDNDGPDDGIAGGNPFADELLLIRPPDDGEFEVIEHTYELGNLRRGEYIFVVVSNIGHFAKEFFEVQGEDEGGGNNGGEPGGNPDGGDGELSPIDLWRSAAFAAGDWIVHPEITDGEANPDASLWNNLQEYFFGTHPLDLGDDRNAVPRPEIVVGEDGKRHLGIRFQRILMGFDVGLRVQGSRDLDEWVDVDHLVEFVESQANLDGIEDVLVCLLEPIEESPYRYLRIVLHELVDEE